MAVSGLPTTEFLLDVARQLSGAEVIDFKTRYKGEVASQYFKVDIDGILASIRKFPNLNNICEAGTRMYWEIKISNEKAISNFANIISGHKNIDLYGDFTIDQTLRIKQNINLNSVISNSKIIVIGGKNELF